MSDYRVIEEVVVRIVSSIIAEDSPHIAYGVYRHNIDTDQLLRNVTGDPFVVEVEFAGRRLSARIEEVDGNGDVVEVADELKEEDINHDW